MKSMSTELYYKNLVIYILLICSLVGFLNVDIIASQLTFLIPIQLLQFINHPLY